MVRETGIFDPEDLNVLRTACEQVCSERRFRSDGLEAQRIALRAITLFNSGYINPATLIRALRQDA